MLLSTFYGVFSPAADNDWRAHDVGSLSDCRSNTVEHEGPVLGNCPAANGFCSLLQVKARVSLNSEHCTVNRSRGHTALHSSQQALRTMTLIPTHKLIAVTKEVITQQRLIFLHRLHKASDMGHCVAFRSSVLL